MVRSRRKLMLVSQLRLAAFLLSVVSLKGILAWSPLKRRSVLLGESSSSMRILSSSLPSSSSPSPSRYGGSCWATRTLRTRPHRSPPFRDFMRQPPPARTTTRTLFLGAGSILDYNNARTTPTRTHATAIFPQRRWSVPPTTAPSSITTTRTTPPPSSSTTTTTTRLFGSRVGSTDAPPGTITVLNEQDALPDVDLDRLRTTARDIRQLLGYETYDLTIALVDDAEMREANRDSRGVDRPTDILSFQFHDTVNGDTPGVLEEPRFDIADYYTLGDILIDVPYVMRVCADDGDQAAAAAAAADELDDDEMYDDRGVAAAMEHVRDPKRRLQMLLVHGMLHLVGYDHETDDDYETMVTKEDEFLEKLGMKKSKSNSSASTSTSS